MEGHHVAVDRHQAEQPGGADEQQQEEGHAERRTEEGGNTQVSFVSAKNVRILCINFLDVVLHIESFT